LRRDRINGSLDEIKHLVLEALNKDVSLELIFGCKLQDFIHRHKS